MNYTDNISYVSNIISPIWSLASFTGSDVAPLVTLMVVLIIITTWAFAYKFSGSIIISALSVVPWIIITAMFDFIPMWMALFIGLSVAFQIALSLYLTPTEATAETTTIETSESTWDFYGRRIKEAYSAKFGGENYGFNQEVDAHIEIMNHNGRGFTRSLAYDWLRRMSKFTESK